MTNLDCLGLEVIGLREAVSRDRHRSALRVRDTTRRLLGEHICNRRSSSGPGLGKRRDFRGNERYMPRFFSASAQKSLEVYVSEDNLTSLAVSCDRGPTTTTNEVPKGLRVLEAENLRGLRVWICQTMHGTLLL